MKPIGPTAPRLAVLRLPPPNFTWGPPSQPLEIDPQLEEIRVWMRNHWPESPPPLTEYPRVIRQPHVTRERELTTWLDSFFTPEEIAMRGTMRPRYADHKDDPLLEPYFRALASPSVPRGGVSLVASSAKLCYSTADTWHRVLQVDPTWRPSHEAYRVSHLVFTEEEEYELMLRINMKFLKKGLLFTDTLCQAEARKLATEVIAKLDESARQGEHVAGPRYLRLLEFRASLHFVADFRDRHAVSLRRPTLKRRPTVNVEALDAFIKRVREILRLYPANRVINIDETNWRVVQGAFKTWAPRGAESAQCKIDDDEKAGVTAIGAVDAAGNKLPLTVIGKGKTRRCLAGYQRPSTGVFALTSINGWTTSDVMCSYLEHLRRDIHPTDPICVIMDTYSAHRNDLVKARATELGIRLEFIPPGCTDLLQPLDRRVFGVLKSSGRQQWLEHYGTEGRKTSRPEMAASLLRAWDRIGRQVIESAWNIYLDECEKEEEEADDPRDGTYRPPDHPILDDFLA
jgi:hypothetical protein